MKLYQIKIILAIFGKISHMILLYKFLNTILLILILNLTLTLINNRILNTL